jgi:hypothetical protein
LVTLVEHLAPQIEAFCIEHDLNVDTKVLSYLSQKTMVGVLPQPHPIITHSFIYSPPMQQWVTAYLWVLDVDIRVLGTLNPFKPSLVKSPSCVPPFGLAPKSSCSA